MFRRDKVSEYATSTGMRLFHVLFDTYITRTCYTYIPHAYGNVEYTCSGGIKCQSMQRLQGCVYSTCDLIHILHELVTRIFHVNIETWNTHNAVSYKTLKTLSDHSYCELGTQVFRYKVVKLQQFSPTKNKFHQKKVMHQGKHAILQYNSNSCPKMLYYTMGQLMIAQLVRHLPNLNQHFRPKMHIFYPNDKKSFIKEDQYFYNIMQFL